MLKTVKVTPAALALCGVKAERVENLTREEIKSLMSWCDYQTESLWDDMNLQEILNVYRVSADWEDFESWAQEEGDIARKAWNKVVRKENHLKLLD